MNQESIDGLIGTLALVLTVAYLGYHVEKKRIHLRRIFDIVDDEEIRLLELLDEMRNRGELAATI